MTRDEAHAILIKYLTNPNLIKHCLATEAGMRSLYVRLNPQYNQAEQEKWGMVGLLHDADYELAKGRPEVHGLLLFQKEPNLIPQDIAYAIKAHNFEHTKVEPKTLMDWSIYCVDQLTGLIVAATLIHPTPPSGEAGKKLSSITPEFVLNRFNEKSFAKGADRNSIKRCEEKLGIALPEFIAITLNAMQGISNVLGL